MYSPTPLATMAFSEGCLIVTILGDWDLEYLENLQEAVVQRVKKSAVKGLVIDMGAVTSVDSCLVNGVQRLAQLASLMGVGSRVTGIKPGVAAAMVALDLAHAELIYESTNDQAIKKLLSLSGSRDAQ